MKKILQWLAVAVFAVLVCVPALAQAQTVPTTITSFRVTDKNKQDLTSAFTNQDIYLTASWSATSDVHEGDTFSLAIPDVLDFPATNAASFDIYAPDGAVMATAQVTPGRVTVTYTSWVDGKDHVQGTLWLAATVTVTTVRSQPSRRLHLLQSQHQLQSLIQDHSHSLLHRTQTQSQSLSLSQQSQRRRQRKPHYQTQETQTGITTTAH